MKRMKKMATIIRKIKRTIKAMDNKVMMDKEEVKRSLGVKKGGRISNLHHNNLNTIGCQNVI